MGEVVVRYESGEIPAEAESTYEEKAFAYTGTCTEGQGNFEPQNETVSWTEEST